MLGATGLADGVVLAAVLPHGDAVQDGWICEWQSVSELEIGRYRPLDVLVSGNTKVQSRSSWQLKRDFVRRSP